MNRRATFIHSSLRCSICHSPYCPCLLQNIVLTIGVDGMSKKEPEKKPAICVECGHEVSELYSPNAIPGNIKLSICVCPSSYSTVSGTCKPFGQRDTEMGMTLTLIPDTDLQLLSLPEYWSFLDVQAHCNSFADKYVEYDIVLIALDMILHRLGVYRHILFNLPRNTNEFSVCVFSLPLISPCFCYIQPTT